MSQIDPRIVEQFNARAPFKLQDATLLVLAVVGSHSHNTVTDLELPGVVSDKDYMGIVIPPIEYTLGVREWEGMDFKHEELDCVFYSFRKFISMLIKSNPNVLGLLWQRDEDYIAYSNPLWPHILNRRDIFSSLAAYSSFMGYAYGQMKRMVSFTAGEQEKYEDAIRLITEAGWTVEQIVTEAHREMPKTFTGIPSMDQRIMEELKSAANRIKLVQTRVFHRNMGEKRKALVKKFGYDTKNAAHLIRLMRMCCDFLETGKMKVYRDHDAEHIKSIKRGEHSIDDVRAEADIWFDEATKLKEVSKLPKNPDIDRINELCVKIYLGAYGYQKPFTRASTGLPG